MACSTRWKGFPIPPWKIWRVSSLSKPGPSCRKRCGSRSAVRPTDRPAPMRVRSGNEQVLWTCENDERRELGRAAGRLNEMSKDLTQLGRAVAQPASPDKAKLESVPNPHPNADYVVRFTAPEF